MGEKGCIGITLIEKESERLSRRLCFSVLAWKNQEKFGTMETGSSICQVEDEPVFDISQPRGSVHLFCISH